MVSIKINFPHRISNLPLLVLEKGKPTNKTQRKHFRDTQYKTETGQRNSHIYFIFGCVYSNFKIFRNRILVAINHRVFRSGIFDHDDGEIGE